MPHESSKFVYPIDPFVKPKVSANLESESRVLYNKIKTVKP